MHEPTQEHIQCPCYLWLCDIVLFVPCFCIPGSSSCFIPCFPVGVLNWTIVNKLPGTENCLACAAFGSWLLSDVLELCFFNYYYYFQFGWLFDSRKSFISFYIHIVVWMKRTFCFQYESTPNFFICTNPHAPSASHHAPPGMHVLLFEKHRCNVTMCVK